MENLLEQREVANQIVSDPPELIPAKLYAEVHLLPIMAYDVADSVHSIGLPGAEDMAGVKLLAAVPLRLVARVSVCT